MRDFTDLRALLQGAADLIDAPKSFAEYMRVNEFGLAYEDLRWAVEENGQDALPSFFDKLADAEELMAP